MDLDADTAWNALAAHDARFDGRFFVGVTSTRIYCRPVCRVRTPRRENCRFYANAASAEQAGFRPCLRCRPELAPGLSLVDSSHVLAQHAARMIEHAVRVGAAVRMPALANRLGVTERHLRRVFAQAHGVSPIAYLTTQRLLQAKQLLTDTDLPVTQVALACGFESLRRFNAVFAEQVRLKPTELRGAARPAPAGGPRNLRIRLGYRPPYDIDGMLDFWARRALPGIEEVTGRVMRRTWRAPRHAQDEPGAGTPDVRGWIEVEFLEARHEVELRASAHLAAHAGQLVEATRHALDLDADPEHQAPLWRALAERHPGSAAAEGLRLPGSFDGFETAARIVLGQQVTVAAARTLTRRLVERFGAPVETPWPGLDRCFPDAATLAAATPESIGELGIVRQRAGALQALARAVADGLPLHRGAPLEATQAALLALPGIGDWTTQLLSLRVLGGADAFPATDIGLLKALGLSRARDAPQAIALAERWRPWRSYAVIALWRALESSDTTGAGAAPEPVPPPETKYDLRANDRPRPPAALQGIAMTRTASSTLPARRTTGSGLVQGRIATPLGMLTALACDAGLMGLWFDGQRHGPGTLDAPVDDDQRCIVAARGELDAYFAGRLREFKVALAPQGTPFQQAVWRRLAAIRCGDTVSYGVIARAIGSPQAARAVGAAVGRNPISVIVPCHRVLGENGTLTGYAGGLHRKQALLDIEGVALPAGARHPAQGALLSCPA